jgi:metallophosphoesterase (TIGR00282 family)
MNILFCGDVVGKSGRECLARYLPGVIKEHKIDFTIINAENATHGFGLSSKHAEEIFSLGVDVITLGNHSFDRKDIKDYLKLNNKIIRPYNYLLKEEINNNIGIYEKNSLKIMVINILGLLFMKSNIDIEDPFLSMEKILKEYSLKKNVDIIIVDFHAEATSEKNAFGFYFDGKVSAVLGTHTHIPTADARILPKKTAYRTDVGMCGDYKSVIGMSLGSSLKIFTSPTEKKRLEPAEGQGVLSGNIVNIDKSTGLCNNIQSILMGEL